MQLTHIYRTLSALALVTAAQAAPDQLNKTYEWGDSSFGIKATADARVRLQGGDKLTSSGDFSFKTKLFGGQKTFRAEIDGEFRDSRKEMYAECTGSTFFGNSFTFSRSKNFNSTGEREIFETTILEVDRQFTVWGVPCIIIVDITADGHIGYGYDVHATGLNPNQWRHEYEVYTRLGATGRVTAGPGSGLAGLGAYGKVRFGELKLAVARAYPWFGTPNVWTHYQGQLELDMGDFEIGVRAWVAGVEKEIALMTQQGYWAMLKRVNL